MSHEEIRMPEKPDLLKKINLILARLGYFKIDKLPERIKNIEVLKEKTIAMVDDDLDVLSAFIPDLVVATDGKADFIHYSEEAERGMRYVIEQILQMNPDIVLMDYRLSDRVTGDLLAQHLKRQGFAGSVIGFSSGAFGPGGASDYFKEAGVPVTINKDRYAPSISIRHLAEELSEK